MTPTTAFAWIIVLVTFSSSLCTFHSSLPATQHTSKRHGKRSLDLLAAVYSSDGTEKFKCRNVPGDGSCLFHSLAACVTYYRCQRHLEFDDKMRQLSTSLRRLSVKILKQKNKILKLEEDQEMTCQDLLQMVSEHYNMTSKEYANQMSREGTWGGGPEIVALSNYFRRPIHVYELSDFKDRNSAFKFRICAKFGSPGFDDKIPYYILCVDGRFPKIEPDQAKHPGDHFLALFPQNIDTSTASDNQPKPPGIIKKFRNFFCRRKMEPANIPSTLYSI